jgi:hypothetical protein
MKELGVECWALNKECSRQLAVDNQRKKIKEAREKRLILEYRIINSNS